MKDSSLEESKNLELWLLIGWVVTASPDFVVAGLEKMFLIPAGVYRASVFLLSEEN